VRAILENAVEYHDKRDELISINPSIEQEIARISAMNREEIDEVLSQAEESFRVWSSLSIRDRQDYISNLTDIILQEREEIAELIAQEQGKPATEALGAEIIATLSSLQFLAKNAEKYLKPRKAPNQMILFTSKKSYFHFVPYGVIAVISPWNFPFSVPVPQIAAALVAGNTVVHKPAPSSVLIGRKIDEIFRKAGLPQGVFNSLFIRDQDASYLTGHPKVKKIIFTGSTQVGKKVMASAATNLTPVILELGGKDAAVVARDANIARAAKGIVWGAFFGSGQVCASVERVYVESPVAEKFINACIEEARKLKIGDPLDKDTEIGPMSNRAQLESVQAQIEDALEKGAEIVLGGKQRQPGFFFEPTILTNVNHSMRIMTEETFGPILPIMVVDSVDEAIRLANSTPFGLSAFGWTQSRKTAKKLLNDLQAGIVVINDSTFSWGEPTAPWGGIKVSGIGKTRAQFGLQEMVQIKYTSYDKSRNKTNLWWFPYNGSLLEIYHRAAELFFSRSLWQKIKAALGLVTKKRFAESAHWPSIISNFYKIF